MTLSLIFCLYRLFSAFPLSDSLLLFRSFSVNGVLHAEQHRPDFCTIISSDRTLALFRMTPTGSCDCAAVSLMWTSASVRCFIRSVFLSLAFHRIRTIQFVTQRIRC